MSREVLASWSKSLGFGALGIGGARGPYKACRGLVFRAPDLRAVCCGPGQLVELP